MTKQLSKVELEKLKQIQDDPVLWAKIYLTTYDSSTKKYVPWTARWYQAEMLRDKSRRKVYRCGRRTGKLLPFRCEFREGNQWHAATKLIIRSQIQYIYNWKGSETTQRIYCFKYYMHDIKRRKQK